MWILYCLHQARQLFSLQETGLLLAILRSLALGLAKCLHCSEPVCIERLENILVTFNRISINPFHSDGFSHTYWYNKHGFSILNLKGSQVYTSNFNIFLSLEFVFSFKGDHLLLSLPCYYGVNLPTPPEPVKSTHERLRTPPNRLRFSNNV